MTSLTDEQARLFLEPNFGWLATLRRNGRPQLSVIWVDYEAQHVLFNTAEGRAKLRNLRREPFAVVAVYDRNDPYRWIRVEGPVVELTHERAREHIDALQLKYRGKGPYPLPEGEQRVIARLRPERITTKSSGRRGRG